jgi:hypothetical protein
MSIRLENRMGARSFGALIGDPTTTTTQKTTSLVSNFGCDYDLRPGLVIPL